MQKRCKITRCVYNRRTVSFWFTTLSSASQKLPLLLSRNYML